MVETYKIASDTVEYQLIPSLRITNTPGRRGYFPPHF